MKKNSKRPGKTYKLNCPPKSRNPLNFSTSEKWKNTCRNRKSKVKFIQFCGSPQSSSEVQSARARGNHCMDEQQKHQNRNCSE